MLSRLQAGMPFLVVKLVRLHKFSSNTQFCIWNTGMFAWGFHLGTRVAELLHFHRWSLVSFSWYLGKRLWPTMAALTFKESMYSWARLLKLYQYTASLWEALIKKDGLEKNEQSSIIGIWQKNSQHRLYRGGQGNFCQGTDSAVCLLRLWIGTWSFLNPSWSWMWNFSLLSGSSICRTDIEFEMSWK